MLRQLLKRERCNVRSVARIAGSAAVVLACIAGCATLKPVTVSKGNQLVTISLQTDENVALICRHLKAIACVTRRDESGVTIVSKMPPYAWGIDQRELELIAEITAHEFCHAVAALLKRPDPCHDEDGGVLHP